MAEPLVTVILPTRNRVEVLGRAVASVLAQTEGHFELIVVDNSDSTIGALTRDRIPGLADSRVRLVRAEVVRNAAGARNVGLARARGGWVTFLDDDDAYRPAKIAAQLKLARRAAAPVVFCGSLIHVRGRTRARFLETKMLTGDALLHSAGFATPLILHRRTPGLRFDETLFAGEDLHYLQALFAHFQLSTAHVVPEPLVDVYQDVVARERTNLRADAGWRAVRRTWWQFGRRYSPAGRRLFVLRALITRAKLSGQPSRVAALLPALLRAGGAREWRYGLNAWAVSTGWFRGRWVT